MRIPAGCVFASIVLLTSALACSSSSFRKDIENRGFVQVYQARYRTATVSILQKERAKLVSVEVADGSGSTGGSFALAGDFDGDEKMDLMFLAPDLFGDGKTDALIYYAEPRIGYQAESGLGKFFEIGFGLESGRKPDVAESAGGVGFLPADAARLLATSDIFRDLNQILTTRPGENDLAEILHADPLLNQIPQGKKWPGSVGPGPARWF